MNSKIFRVFVISTGLLTLVACAPGGYNKGGRGAIGGALIGAAACSNVGKGSGRIAAMIACAAVGAGIGHSIGSYMDEIDKRRVINTIQSTPTNVQSTWVNHGGHNSVTPITGFIHANDGRKCRKYRAKILVDGKYETGEGSACLRPDGYWDI
jgi:surface antigen